MWIMSKKVWLPCLAVFFFLLAVAANQPESLAQYSSVEYFPETGHTLRGDFKTAYFAAVDPVRVYGYPITEPFINQTTGRTVQYFQKAHFELRPEEPAERRVHRAALGAILYEFEKGQPLAVATDFPACKYFPDTGHSVCYAFLDYFNTYGGVQQFGKPISGMEIKNERMVQYFERARFEWHPNKPSGERVVLADLGRLYFDLRRESPDYLRGTDSIPQVILSLQSRAFVSKPVSAQKGEQTLHVVVQDQNMLPVSYAQVVFTISYPSGKEESYSMPITNASGITSFSFQVDEEKSGIAVISVAVQHARLQQNTRASFRIWY
jgi:hypothetical protein